MIDINPHAPELSFGDLHASINDAALKTLLKSKTDAVSGMCVNRVNAEIWFDPEPGSVFGGPGQTDVAHDGEFALELDGGSVISLGENRYAVVLTFEMARSSLDLSAVDPEDIAELNFKMQERMAGQEFEIIEDVTD